MEVKLSFWDAVCILGVLASTIVAIKKPKGDDMSKVKESKELVQAAVAVAHGIETAQKEGFALSAVLSQVVLTIPVVISGLQGFSLVDDEFKVIDEAGIEELVAEAMVLFGDSSPKSKVIVKESVNILLSAFKIFKA